MSDLTKAMDAAQAPQAPSTQQQLKAMIPSVRRALPGAMDPDRFLRLVLTEINRNPRLADCSVESLAGGVLLAAQLGLEPGGVLGQCYLIPRRNKGRMEASFQLGYHGLVELAARNGWVITSNIVRDGDEFDWQDGTDPYLLHRPESDGEPTHYWAVARKEGYPTAFKVWTTTRVKAHKLQFADDRSPAWKDHFDAMARKTVIADLARGLQLTPEAQQGIAADGRVNRNLTAHVLDEMDSDPGDPLPEVVEVERVDVGYSDRKVDELRRMCAERGIPDTGTKGDLVKRLEADDQGFDADADAEVQA